MTKAALERDNKKLKEDLETKTKELDDLNMQLQNSIIMPQYEFNALQERSEKLDQALIEIQELKKKNENAFDLLLKTTEAILHLVDKKQGVGYQ